MTRLRADLLLLFAAAVWGTTFVAQKDAFAHMGPFTFVAARFAISALLVLPLALFERKRVTLAGGGQHALFWLALSFAGAVLFQQVGVGGTSTTNAGFFTGLYVLIVPVICRFAFGQKLPPLIFPAALLSVAGIWLLSGGSLRALGHISRGDALVFLCAALFAVQIILMARVVARTAAPFQLCVLQYTGAAVLATAGAILWEMPSLDGIMAGIGPLLYAGVLSGGIAFTLQAVAQQYTPPSDASMIMAGEAVFAALAGVMLRHEILTPGGIAGCALILAAIVLTELGAFRKS